MACIFKDRCSQFNPKHYCCNDCPVEAIACSQFDQFLDKEGIGEKELTINEKELQEMVSITVNLPKPHLRILEWITENQCYPRPEDAVKEAVQGLIKDKSWCWRREITLRKILMRSKEPHFCWLEDLLSVDNIK